MNFNFETKILTPEGNSLNTYNSLKNYRYSKKYPEGPCL